MTIDLDTAVILHFLDNAQLHGAAKNDWAEGYWIGRAIQHANQNAYDYADLMREMKDRGLDHAVIPLYALLEPWAQATQISRPRLSTSKTTT